MSYSIELEKDTDDIRIKHHSGLEHIPAGLITISGHVPGPGLSPAATLAVTLTGPINERGLRQFVASAATSYAMPSTPTVTAEDGERRGEQAYSGYFTACAGKSLVSGADLPSWDEQAPEIRAAWVAAAAAVR